MSQYPQLIDNNVTLPISDSQTPLSPALFNKLRDAIYKIEVELGIFPSGDTYADVRSRLDAMEGRLANCISINGDIGGDYSNPLVIGIDGTPVKISSLENNQALIYDSFQSAWTNKFFGMDNLKPPFTIKFSTLDATLLEVGDTLSTPAFEAEFTDGYLYVAILTTDQDGYEQSVITSPSSFESVYSYLKNSFGDSVTYTLSCAPYDNPGLSRSKSVTFRWGQKTYWGAAEDPVSLDGYFVQALSNSELTLTKEKTFQLNAGADQYIFFSCRSGYGDVSFLVNDFEGGFSKVATDIEINGEMYDIYRSDNPNLGETSVIAF